MHDSLSDSRCRRVTIAARCVFLASLVLTSRLAWAQAPPPQVGTRFRWLELYGVVGHKAVSFDLPAALADTPTHPQDVDQFRPPRSQPTPLKSDNFPWIGGGVTVRVPVSEALRKFGVGYRIAFPIVRNTFRDGTFVNHQPYSSFIGGEQAYTYTRLTDFGPLSEVRLAYNVLPMVRLHSPTLELGAKYVIYNLKVTQGWDRFDRDEAYRVTAGDGGIWGGFVSAGIPVSGGRDTLEGLIQLSVEYEKGDLTFKGIDGHYSVDALTVAYFGFLLRF